MSNKITYRQQYTRCGKQRCRKCREGSGHGPYWYAYWSENGRTVSKYIGTHLPEHLAPKNPSVEIASPEIKPDRGSQDTPIIRIYLLGQFRIEHFTQSGWQAADNRTWHRRRARALLGSLLSRPGRRLGREHVMKMLWPDLDSDLAANRLNGAVHELRQILEPDISRPSSSCLLRLEREILELADASLLWVDAEAFEQLIKEAEACTDVTQKEHLLEQASTLYQGHYLLEELYSEWATPRRDALQHAWEELQLQLAQIKTEQGAYANAIEILDHLRTSDPTNETALQHLMILLTHLDRRGEALQVYQHYVKALQRDYEGEPLSQTIELYETLRTGSLPPLSSPRTITPQETTSTAQFTSPLTQQTKTQLPPSYPRPLFQHGRQHQHPLIGREQEQQRMRDLLLTIEQHRGSIHSSEPKKKMTHLLLLRGEAGIGKTRLAEELSLEAYDRGWTVAWSRTYEQEDGTPYHSWTELLRALLQRDSTFSELVTTSTISREMKNPSDYPLKLDQLSTLLPELAVPVHSSQPSPESHHEQKGLHLWEATLELLVTLSKSYPLLLVFDDLHWADEKSIELLTYLTHHLQGQRILLIATCRDGELAPQHKLRALTADLQREKAIAMISVHPLTPSQIGTLVAYLPEHIICSIQTQSSGNPFFAEELARLVSTTQDEKTAYADFFPSNTTEGRKATQQGLPLKQTKRVEHAHVTSSGLLPDAIMALLERRLHRLSPGCRTLLGKAAVLGGSFELAYLLPMALEYEEEALLDFLEEALHAGLLTEEVSKTHIIYHFWHPLIVSHLYNRISAARKAQLHRKAAEAIKVSSPQSEETAATILYHLSKGGNEPTNSISHPELPSMDDNDRPD